MQALHKCHVTRIINTFPFPSMSLQSPTEECKPCQESTLHDSDYIPLTETGNSQGLITFVPRAGEMKAIIKVWVSAMKLIDSQLDQILLASCFLHKFPHSCNTKRPARNLQVYDVQGYELGCFQPSLPQPYLKVKFSL